MDFSFHLSNEAASYFVTGAVIVTAIVQLVKLSFRD